MSRRLVMVFGVVALGCGSGSSAGDVVADGWSRDVPMVDRADPGDEPGDLPREDRGFDAATDLGPGADGTASDPGGAPDANDDVDDAKGEVGPSIPPCRRSSACGNDATCNLSSGGCEDRAPGWGTRPAILSVYPVQGAPGDFLVVDGAGFLQFSTTVKIGAVSVGALSMDIDENRLVIPRPAGASGVLTVSGLGGSAQYQAPIDTSTAYRTVQPCQPDDPPATGVPGAEAAVAGPYAVGFVDASVNSSGLRVFYPATCGGMRRPPASGTFPFVLILHGDGCASLEYEYLGRHLASWGFLAAIPGSVANWDHQQIIDKGLNSPQDWLPELAGRGAGGSAVVFCHSMGAERTLQLLSTSAPVQAVVFLGPVYTTTSPYGQSLFPVPGLVIGGSQDGQSSASTFDGVYDQLQAPKYLANLQGGNHSQFTDDKLWDGTPNGSDPGILARNRQFELVQSFSLAFLQRIFGLPQPFATWLVDPGLPDEVVFKSQP